MVQLSVRQQADVVRSAQVEKRFASALEASCSFPKLVDPRNRVPATLSWCVTSPWQHVLFTLILFLSHLQSDKALYILISQAVQGRTQTTLERKINLSTINSVGMSNLRDDWLVCLLSRVPVLPYCF